MTWSTGIVDRNAEQKNKMHSMKWKIMPITCNCNTLFYILEMLLLENDWGTKRMGSDCQLQGVIMNCDWCNPKGEQMWS